MEAQAGKTGRTVILANSLDGQLQFISQLRRETVAETIRVAIAHYVDWFEANELGKYRAKVEEQIANGRRMLVLEDDPDKVRRVAKAGSRKARGPRK